jgi:excisionase family DNA binding protein
MPNALQVPALLLTSRQAAAALAIGERTLFRHVKAGTIPALHLGGALRFDPRDLTALIDRLKAPVEASV